MKMSEESEQFDTEFAKTVKRMNEWRDEKWHRR